MCVSVRVVPYVHRDRQYVCVRHVLLIVRGACKSSVCSPTERLHARTTMLPSLTTLNINAPAAKQPMRNVDADVFSSVIEVLRARMLNAKQNYDAESICEFFKQYVQLQSANAKNRDAIYEEGCGLLRVNMSSLKSNASDPIDYQFIDYKTTFKEACQCATSRFYWPANKLSSQEQSILRNTKHPFYDTLRFKFMWHIKNSDVSVIKIVPHDYTYYRDLVLAAVQRRGWTLEYASAELKADHDVVLAAVQQYGNALRHESKELQADREVVLAAVTQDGNALRHASKELQADREVVLTAVSNSGDALRWASPKLKADREVVLAAVRNYGYALDYASDELRADPDVRRAAGRRYSL